MSDIARSISVFGRDIVIEQDSNAGDGGTVFDAALVLTKYCEMLDSGHWLGKRVIELGCGCG